MVSETTMYVRAQAARLATSRISTAHLMRCHASATERASLVAGVMQDLVVYRGDIPPVMRQPIADRHVLRGLGIALQMRASMETQDVYACGCGHVWSRVTTKLLRGAIEPCPSCATLCHARMAI